MGNGTAFRWCSLRVLSDNISRARQRLREAEAETPIPLPTPHENALNRLAILMGQMGQAPPPAANLPAIQGVVPVQPLLRLPPPTPVQQSQDDSEDSYGDDEFDGFSEDSSGESSAEEDGETEDLAGDHDMSEDDRTLAAVIEPLQQTIERLARNRKHLKKDIKRLQGTVRRLTDQGHP